MTRRLRTFVHVDGVAYGPDSDVPASVAARIGAHAWVGGAVAESAAAAVQNGPTGLVEPPRSGAGASKAAWSEYAAARGVPVEDGASRDDIIAAVDAATKE